MPATPPIFLLASADPVLLSRIEPAFLAAGVRVEVALSVSAALAAMTGPNPPNLGLVDTMLPGMETGQLLAAVRSSGTGERLPIVLIADNVAQEWLDRMDEGIVDDLILRHAEPAYWQLRANCVQRTHRVVHELGNLRDDAVRNAQLDRLTGVYNREALLSQVFRETDRVQRTNSALTLLLFDLDDFGHWNERLGVDACDELLCQVVSRSARLLRSYDLLGRTGKDEFLIVLPGCGIANAETMAERLRLEVFSAPYRVAGESIRLSACFGIAQSHGRSPVVVLREAEHALSRAKQGGAESIEIYGGSMRPTPAPVKFLSSQSGDELLAW